MQSVDLPSTPYSTMPKWLIILPIPLEWKFLYTVIASYGGFKGEHRHPSVRTLAKLCGRSMSTVREWSAGLEKLGLIRRVNRTGASTGQKANLFLLFEPESMDELKHLMKGSELSERYLTGIKLGRQRKQNRSVPLDETGDPILKLIPGRAPKTDIRKGNTA